MMVTFRVRLRPDQEARHRLDRLLRCRETDPLQAVAAQGVEPLERKREMGAALVRRQRMDLVDDHRPRRRQHRAAGFGAEEDVERLGRGHHDMRRAPAHPIALARRRVAGPDEGPNGYVGQPERGEPVANAFDRRFQIAFDVVGERLERRDVDDLRLVFQLTRQPLPDQAVDRPEEGGERLAGAGRRREQAYAGRPRSPTMPRAAPRWGREKRPRTSSRRPDGTRTADLTG